MKRILLITPSTGIFDHRLFPPLSLAAVASGIPDSYEVRILDENVAPVSFETDLAALSVNTYSARRAYEIAAEFRKRGVPVILGGNHPTIVPEEAARRADAVVIGDGETVWPEILRDFENRRLKATYGPNRYGFDRDLSPRRELLSGAYRFDSLETVRGCPFNCAFCSVTRFHGATFRLKPLRLIERELKELKTRTIFIVDDNLIGAGRRMEERTEELFALLRARGLRWMAQSSLHIAAGDRLLRAAKESGCLFLFLGFESLSPAVLRTLRKHHPARVSEYRDIVKKIHDHGIGVMGSFIIGMLGETADSLARLKEFILDSGIDIPNITHLTPYPGTAVYESLNAENRLFDKRFWMKDPFPLFNFQPERMTVSALRRCTLDLMDGILNPFRSAKRFFGTLKRTSSLRVASFCLAESLIAGRTLKKALLQDAKEPAV